MNHHLARFLFFKLQLKNILIFSVLFFPTSCMSYKCNSESFLSCCKSENKNEELCQENEQKASEHWLYTIIPRHRSQIYWYDLPHWTTWMLFGNDDDGLFGEVFKKNDGRIVKPYKPNKKNTFGKALNMWLRNPLHNFCHYTIGSAERVNGELTLLNLNSSGIESLRYCPHTGRNYGAEGSSLFLALHGGKPFFSLRLIYPWHKKTELYLGWRKTGSFGMKCLPCIDERTHASCFFNLTETEDCKN